MEQTIGALNPKMAQLFMSMSYKGPHVVTGMVLLALTHLSTHVTRNYLLIGTVSPCGQPNLAPWVLIQLEPHMPINMPNM
jgi:hypothetical protein